MFQSKKQEVDIVSELSILLRRSGDKILSGESKLTLTTQALSRLYVSFRRYSETSHQGDGPAEGRRRGNTQQEEQLQRWRTNIQFLNDFISKTVSLKLTNGPQTMQEPVYLSRFRNLEVLELKKIPIHMLHGLQKLRGQLKVIIVSRCLQNLEDLLETCGGDLSAPMSWPQLTSLYASCNGLQKLDNSLRLLPDLEVLDLSHNQLYKTERFLEALSEIIRVNLGYNILDTLPAFCLSAKPKIRTLILRNNNLDNLEGIDDLVCLEELDVSSNCLVDHSCLIVLSSLSKLNRLSLQGNPLSFHRSHRALTLQHITATAGRNTFTLDGKVISPTERLLTQKSHISASRRPSQEAHSIITGLENSSSRQRIQQAYRFDDSDNIATSLKVGSPGKKKARRRSKMKNRLSADGRLLDVSTTDADSSRENSRAGSPVRQEGQSTIREEVEVLRDHYGVNWLQVITANKAAAMKTKQSGFKVDTMEPTQNEVKIQILEKEQFPNEIKGNTINTEHQQIKKVNKTEDDIYLNDSTVGLNDDHRDISTHRHSDDDIEVLSSENEESHMETVIQREESSCEIYSKRRDSPAGEESHSGVELVKREDSSHGVEWQRINEEYYGSESEPYIVTLPDQKDTQLIVTVNERYIVEKDLNGKIVEMLDIKCLQSVTLSQGVLSPEEVDDGQVVLPTLKMKFDYIRKDRRERMYVMEDDENAESFKSLLQPHLEAKEMDRKLQGLLQCLKCSAQFDKSEAEPSHISLLQSLSKNSSKDDIPMRYFCPKCKSQMVVQVDTQEKSSSQQSTPIGSYSSISSQQNILGGVGNRKITPTKSTVIARSPAKVGHGSPLSNSSIVTGTGGGTASPIKRHSPEFENGNEMYFHGDRNEGIISGSPVAKSTPLKDKAADQRVSLIGQKLPDDQRMEHNSQVVMSRSDGFPRIDLEGQVNRMTKSSTSVAGEQKDICVTTPTENKAFQRNQSWSDVNTALSNKTLQHRTSVDSDITILTNTSESSVAVISESSIETIPEPKVKVADLGQCQEQTESIFNPNLPLPLSSNNALCQGDLQGGSGGGSKRANLNGIAEEQGEITPIGSPLSTSICSSMVSSVYENSLVTASEENLNTLLDNGDVITEDNNNRDCASIYDNNYNDSIYDNNVENEHRTSLTTQDKSQDVIDNVTNDFHSAVSIQNQSDLYTTEEKSDAGKVVILEAANGNQMEASSGSEVSVPEVIGQTSTDVDYSSVDHRLKLYLMMHILEDGDECQCAMECDIVQYMALESVHGVVVFTFSKIIILKILAEYSSESLDKSLSCIENQPITELQYVDIGLGYQTLRFEFDTECSSYSFLIRDEKRCKAFIGLITGIVQNTAFSEHSRLEGISKYNATTLDNLQHTITSGDLEEGEITEDDNYMLVRYLSCHHVVDSGETEDDHVPVGLAVTATDMCMVKENHQWPLPRLQAPLSDEVKGQQFTLLGNQKINNIATVEMCETDHTQLRFTFFNEESGEETCWQLSFTTTDSVQSLVDAIRDPWESEFGVALDITPVSFTED